MATYAVGDVQGCLSELEALLKQIDFSSSDRIIFLGDLINRGPDSLGTLRLIKSLGDQAIIVLGNHDLHFLAILFGGHPQTKSDTLTELIEAKDAEDLGHWLRTQPLIHYEDSLDALMVHAGVPFFWSTQKALSLAGEVHRIISSTEGTEEKDGLDYRIFFKQMYGNNPNYWAEGLTGMGRYRAITNYFTRMRFLDFEGKMDFSFKGAKESAPDSLTPWYSFGQEGHQTRKVLFGHWASLNGVTGREEIIALDTGCVWGRCLTAYCMETKEFLSVKSFKSNK